MKKYCIWPGEKGMLKEGKLQILKPKTQNLKLQRKICINDTLDLGFTI
jgi:hypothetical protein